MVTEFKFFNSSPVFVEIRGINVFCLWESLLGGQPRGLRNLRVLHMLRRATLRLQDNARKQIKVGFGGGIIYDLNLRIIGHHCW